MSPEVFLRLTDVDGTHGWGAAAPKWYITGETQESVAAVLRDRLLPWLLQQRRLSLETLSDGLDRAVRGNWAAKAAIDVAVHDLLGRQLGIPVYEMLGGIRDGIDLGGLEVVFLSEGQSSIEEVARSAVERGYRNLKLKADSDVAATINRAAELRQGVGSRIHLTVDANQAWSAQATLLAGPAMVDAGINELEQPIAADAIDAMAMLRQELPVPVTLDESVCSAREADEVMRARATDGIVLKVAKSGGIAPCRAIAESAEQAGVYCVAGATLQNAVLEAATAHLYLATPNIRRHEVKLLIRDDVAEGPIISGGQLSVPSEPGLGVEVDVTRLGPPVIAMSKRNKP